MGCNKIKHTCGTKSFANCVNYEKDVPSFSELFGQDCKNVEQIIEDLYSIIGNLKEELTVLKQTVEEQGVLIENLQ